ncbi:tetratricopeptide repeat protein, partial [Mesorhizobium sp. B2-4-14]|uniref:TPR end-of-group domain-containing protein n=1 Tax=Mesorhizobium sp. B2-4-14 TaxID=2589935 RepID=UPI001126B2F3
EFVDQGEKAVKNIVQPVHVFFVNLGGGMTPEAVAGGKRRARPDKPSVAILPFSNMSNDPEQEFFSDGMTEDIITDLSKVSGLFVLGRNTVFTYRGQAVDLEGIARQLGVSYIVEGSVRKAGNRVRINAQLVDGSTGGHLWADRYDRDLSDIFAVQDEITHAIVEQLKVQLLPQEKEAIGRSRTDNVEAYTQYLRARQIFHMGTKSSLMLARRMFARAVELDPLYARAYAGMADCDARLVSKHGASTPIEEILACISKALAIDPHLAEAHAAHGYALMVANRRTEAQSALLQALALDPNCHEAHYHYADFSVTAGDFEQAAEHYIRALELRPDDYISPVLLLNVLRSLGRTLETKGYARLGLKRAEEALRLHPEDSKPAQLGACALVALGDGEQAKQWLARALAIDPEDSGTRYNAACVYSMLGESDRAIDLLEMYLHQVGPDLKLRFKNDSDLDPIRSHPRYQKLLELVAG